MKLKHADFLDSVGYDAITLGQMAGFRMTALNKATEIAMGTEPDDSVEHGILLALISIAERITDRNDEFPTA